jgi:TRAP-type C4-dicarboxylate transport system permease small subunit
MYNRLFLKVLGLTEKILQWIAVSFFIIIFLAATAQIIMRWVFNNPLVWTEELIRLMFIWICYLGWIFATKNSSHIAIPALVDKLGAKGRWVLDLVNTILTIVFSFLLVWFGIQMTRIGAVGRAVTLPVNFAVVYGICPIANVFIIIYQVMHFMELCSRKPASSGEGE